MPCTTIMVGKKATYDGSTMMARNEDSGPAAFCAKKFIAVLPEQQPRHYKSVLCGFEMELPETPMRYTAMPNALPDDGIWGEAGFNEENIAMSATETLTSNSRVLGADPLEENGIGEEDMVTVVLPYIHSAREGVERLGAIIEKYGTCEMNGIGFQDMDEIWWFESVGGHHWMAKRVPDDAYMVGPNQQGIDYFDFEDAYGEKKEHMCDPDMIDFVRRNHLDRGMKAIPLKENTEFDARAAFGSRTDSDHSYNTPRAWFMEKWLNPHTYIWEGPDAEYTPESDDLPWCLIPEKKITPEDIKYVLSSYYQGTEYNPYGKYGDASQRGRYRPIGINRNNFVAITQLRPYVPKEIAAVEWICEGSNAFNAMVPFYGNVTTTPAYLADTTGEVSTDNFYWANRLIGALTDAHYSQCIAYVERYQLRLAAKGHAMLRECDAALPETDVCAYLEACNQRMSDEAQKMTSDVLGKVLDSASLCMKNAFARSDA